MNQNKNRMPDRYNEHSLQTRRVIRGLICVLQYGYVHSQNIHLPKNAQQNLPSPNWNFHLPRTLGNGIFEPLVNRYGQHGFPYHVTNFHKIPLPLFQDNGSKPVCSDASSRCCVGVWCSGHQQLHRYLPVSLCQLQFLAGSVHRFIGIVWDLYTYVLCYTKLKIYFFRVILTHGIQYKWRYSRSSRQKS